MQALSEDLHLDHLRVVLVSTRNPLNIGAAARAMSNFGVHTLRLVNPYEPSFREAKSAVGAAELLQRAEVFSSLSEAIADCSLVIGTTAARERELHQSMRSAAEGVPLIRSQLASGNVAILFGSEKRGLSNEDLSHCHWLMHIPTRTEHLSMNLGQSVAICLYELVRDRAVAQHLEGKEATAEELERLQHVLLEALITSDYVRAGTNAATEDNIRRLLRRMHLESADAELLLGMLRKINWKLNAND
jgi:TrmH family RNA methyltransferase